MGSEEINSIRSALQSLRTEEQKLRGQIEPLMAQWRHKQEQIAALEHALELLEAEPQISNLEVALQPDGRIGKPTDLAYKVLAEGGKPLHYRELLGLMEVAGFVMPGSNPGANLLAHVGRDKRIVRVGPGTYGLAEWGMKRAAARRRRKGASRSSRRAR